MGRRSDTAPGTPVADQHHPPRGGVVTVGLGPDQLASLPLQLFGELGRDAVAVDYDMLYPDRISEAMVVLSPVVGPGFDAVDVALRLVSSNYRGRYIAVSHAFPDAASIKNEVGAAAPGLPFDIIDLGRGLHVAQDHSG